jgi:hypothetical protein
MALFTDIKQTLFGGRSRAFLSDGFDDLLLNVTMETTESDQIDITNHAIEKGSDVSDHAYSQPKTLSLKVVLTDDVLALDDPLAILAPSIIDRLELLQGWLDDKTLLTYYGHDYDFDDMLIESVSRNKSADTGTGLGLDITLKMVTIAKSLTTALVMAGQSATGSASTSGAAAAEVSKSWSAAIVGL